MENMISVAGEIGMVVSTKGGWTKVAFADGSTKSVRNSAIAEAPLVTVEQPVAVRLCDCGCGETVAKRSAFRQGHDQRLKGILLRCFDAGDDDSGHQLVSRGWRSQAELEARRAEATAKAEAKAAKAAK